MRDKRGTTDMGITRRYVAGRSDAEGQLGLSGTSLRHNWRNFEEDFTKLCER
jgi:hypothetical protein